jgi:hypothetical protein
VFTHVAGRDSGTLPVHMTDAVGASAAPTAIGVALLANSVGIATGATVRGWVAGRVGARRVAVLALLAAGILTAPQIWATDTVSFAATRFALGLCAGGVLPLLRAALAPPADGSGDKSNPGHGLRTGAECHSRGICARCAASLYRLAASRSTLDPRSQRFAHGARRGVVRASRHFNQPVRWMITSSCPPVNWVRVRGAARM